MTHEPLSEWDQQSIYNEINRFAYPDVATTYLGLDPATWTGTAVQTDIPCQGEFVGVQSELNSTLNTFTDEPRWVLRFPKWADLDPNTITHITAFGMWLKVIAWDNVETYHMQREITVVRVPGSPALPYETPPYDVLWTQDKDVILTEDGFDIRI